MPSGRFSLAEPLRVSIFFLLLMKGEEPVDPSLYDQTDFRIAAGAILYFSAI
jgi:hypothetical protein